MKQLQSTLMLHETVCNMSRSSYGVPNSAGSLEAAAAAAAAASAPVSATVSSGGLSAGLSVLGRSLNATTQRSPPLQTPLSQSLGLTSAHPHAHAHSLTQPLPLPVSPAHQHFSSHFANLLFPQTRGLPSGTDLGSGRVSRDANVALATSLASSGLSGGGLGGSSGLSDPGMLRDTGGMLRDPGILRDPGMLGDPGILGDPGMLLVGAAGPRAALQRANARAQQPPTSSAPLLNVRPRNLY